MSVWLWVGAGCGALYLKYCSDVDLRLAYAGAHRGAAYCRDDRRGRAGGVTPSQDDRLAALLQENAEINSLLQQQVGAHLTNLHRPLERFGLLLSRPTFILTALTLFILWILLNLRFKFTTHTPWDEPPFFWLQGLIGLLSLIVTVTVLVSQARQAQLAEQRAQLQLQIVLLTEQRSAKIIALLEELRRDLPNVKNRVDRDANVMQQASRPGAILEALNTLSDDAVAKDAASTQRPPEQGQ